MAKLNIELLWRPAVVLVALASVIVSWLASPGGPLTNVVTVDGVDKSLPRGYFAGGGRSRLPYIGDNLDYLSSAFRFLDDRYARFGNASRTFLFGSPTIVLAGAEGMRKFYDTRHVRREGAYPWWFARLLGGHGILNMMDDAAFTERRGLIERAAGYRDPTTLDAYLLEATDVFETYIRKWAGAAPGYRFRMAAEAHAACAEVAARVFLGYDHAAAREVGAKLAGWASDILNAAQAPPLPVPGSAFWRGQRAGAAAHAHILDRLRAHANHSLPWSRPYPHALGVLARRMEPGLLRPGLKHDTEAGVATEVLHMAVAATALVGNALSDLAMVLRERPDVAGRVAAEVASRLGTDRSRPLTTERLNRLAYSRAVVDETRRLFPFVAGMLGRVTKGFDVPSQGASVHVPANATVVGAFYLTQRAPEEWTDPTAFDPDRFARGEPRSGFGWAWTPHGSPKGRHHCPGVDLTTHLMLAFLAQVYRDGCSWEVPPGQPSPTRQRLSLFNPEPVGSTFYGWRCAAYPRPEEYGPARAAAPAPAAATPAAPAAATAAPAPTPMPVPVGGSGHVEEAAGEGEGQ